MATETGNPQKDVIMWVQLPKPMNPAELRKMGLGRVACYGGDTCIASTELSAKAGIVVQQHPGERFRRAGLVPQDPCFGGDTCIV